MSRDVRVSWMNDDGEEVEMQADMSDAEIVDVINLFDEAEG